MPQTKYILCGTGKLFDKMEKLVEKLNLSDAVIFAGYRKDINKILQVSDLMLLLSKQEGLTMSIMEAMHYGLPVVTSDVRGNRDLIDDSFGGKLVDLRDVSGSAGAIIDILRDQNLAIKMGEYNREKVKKYDIDVVRAELKNIYNEVSF